MARCSNAFIMAGLLLGGCSAGQGPVAPDQTPGPQRVYAPWGPQRLDNFSARILELHNVDRRAVGVAPLTWDPQLVKAAYSYATTLARLGRLEHSSIASRPGQGENLWMGTNGAYSLEQMVGEWSGERALFKPGIFPDIARNGNWTAVGHYTQMIWPDTTAVGCALHKVPGGDYLVCRYSPAGNVQGQRIP